jgi:hypothetical protein
MYFIQHCYFHSDSTVTEDAGIEPRTVATLALAVRLSSHWARSHPHGTRSHLIFMMQAGLGIDLLSAENNLVRSMADRYRITHLTWHQADRDLLVAPLILQHPTSQTGSHRYWYCTAWPTSPGIRRTGPGLSLVDPD